MPYAIQFRQPGSADNLEWCEVEMPTPAENEILIKHSALGVNFIDIYHRSGLYPLPHYPAIPGIEGVGVVVECGKNVTHFNPGDRVAYARSLGAYSEYRVLPESLAVALPDAMGDVTAASVMVKGLTVHYLLHRTFPVKAGHNVLIHAAAGGVGLLFCQWAKHLGARVIGTVSTTEKASLAKAHGCDEVILYAKEPVAERVKELTQGQGVDAVFDSVGKDTFSASLDSLRRFGTLVNFGQSSGSIPPFDISLLQQKGSLYLTRPTLMHHAEDTAWYRQASADLFNLLLQKHISSTIDRVLPLKEAKQAHALLESRATKGAIVLTA